MGRIFPRKWLFRLQYWLGKRPNDFLVSEGEKLIMFCAANRLKCSLIQTRDSTWAAEWYYEIKKLEKNQQLIFVY